MGEHPITLLIMATMLEAKPFVAGMGLNPVCDNPFPVLITDRLTLLISGIGKAHAAAAACYGCLRFTPDNVVNAGAAGALDANHPAGGIYQVDRILEHDRPDIFTGQPVSHEPDQIDGIDTALLVTGDRPVIEPEDRKQLSALAGLVDMEAAAVVQVCRIMNTPCYVFKFVSDDPGHTQGEDIVQNIRRFRTDLYTFCAASVLPRLNGRAGHYPGPRP